jgi:hypothetical protein
VKVGSGDIGRMLMGAGLALALVGVLFMLADRLGIGRLPGDLRFGHGDVHVYIPLTTCLLISIIATIVLNLFLRR